MVIYVIKNVDSKSKCAKVDASDYRVLTDNLSNPFSYNFGKMQKKCNSAIFKKLHNKINAEYFKSK